MKIANLSVHTMRTRWCDVRDWLQRRRPDIVALQKIGSKKDFPTGALRDIGYKSRFLGRRSAADLGVAILSHCNLPQPEVRVTQLPGAEREEARFLTANVGGLWISSVYAPYAQGSNPQQAITQRVAWLNRLRDHIRDVNYSRWDSLLCGDFNVMVPADGPPRRPWYSEKEQAALEELRSLGFIDLYRVAHPDPQLEPGYTFGFRWNAKGTSRLHLALASKSLAERLRKAWVDVDARPRKDAAPLVVEFDGNSTRGGTAHGSSAAHYSPSTY